MWSRPDRFRDRHEVLKRGSGIRRAEAAVVLLAVAILAELLLPGYVNGERAREGLLETTVLPWTRNICLVASVACGTAWIVVARRKW